MFNLAKVYRTHEGFTLIELLVVVTIIGLLGTVVMTSLNKARAQSRDARRIKDAEEIYKAVQMFYDDNGHYPCYNPGDPQYVFIKSDSTASNNCLVRDLQEYISKLPYDPGGKHAYFFPYEYQRDTRGQAFYIRVALEGTDYKPENNYELSGSCAVPGLPTCRTYGYCRVVPRALTGGKCGYIYIIGVGNY